MLNLLKKKYLKTIIIPEACQTLKIDGAFWPNLKSLNKLIWGTVKGRTLKLKKKKKKKKKIENSICFGFTLPTYSLLYVPFMQNFKKMHAREAAGCAKLG